jgi:hypothetical protein
MPDSFALESLCSHWPFVDRRIDWRQGRSQRAALGILATLQLQAGGPAQMGASRMRQLVLVTDGEARHLIRALASLETRGIVWRHPHRGSRPASWSLNPDLTRWRRIRWETSARDVGAPVRACICGGASAIVGEFPVQASHLRVFSGAFRLRPADHLSRSGVLPAEILHAREPWSTLAHSRHDGPVDFPHNRAAESRDTPIYGSSKEELSLEPEIEERVNRLNLAIRGASTNHGTIWPGTVHWLPLVAYVRSCNDAQLELSIEYASAATGLMAPGVLRRVLELPSSPAFRALAA